MMNLSDCNPWRLASQINGIPWTHDAVDAIVMPNLMKGGSATCTLGCHYWSANNPQYRADGSLIEGKYFDGLIDELHVWDDALTQAGISNEIRHDHCTPLIAFWGPFSPSCFCDFQ